MIEIQFLVLFLVHPVVVSGRKIGCREVMSCGFSGAKIDCREVMSCGFFCGRDAISGRSPGRNRNPNK